MNSISRRLAVSLSLAHVLLMSGCVIAQADVPVRSIPKECKWVNMSDESVGLSAWVQECDFGFRKIDFVFQDKSLTMRYSDSGKPTPVIEVIDLLPYETVETGMRRFFFTHSDKSIAKRCVLSAYTGGKPAAGTKRFTFLPNAEYRKELKARARPDEIPEPPCGEWGEGAEGVQYFAVWPQSTVRKVLFVREGQDEPMFDEQSLKLIVPDTRPGN